MSIRSFFVAAGAAVIVAALVPRPASAQHNVSLEVSDSVAKVGRRLELQPGKSIITRSGDVALLLTESAVVLQMTDGGLRAIERDVPPREENLLARLAGAIVRAGVLELLDHSIAYPLARLDHAKAEGNVIQLLDRTGELVFDSVSVNDRRPMHDFSPSEARVFARKINAAIARSARRD